MARSWLTTSTLASSLFHGNFCHIFGVIATLPMSLWLVSGHQTTTIVLPSWPAVDPHPPLPLAPLQAPRVTTFCLSNPTTAVAFRGILRSQWGLSDEVNYPNRFPSPWPTFWDWCRLPLWPSLLPTTPPFPLAFPSLCAHFPVSQQLDSVEHCQHHLPLILRVGCLFMDMFFFADCLWCYSCCECISWTCIIWSCLSFV